MLAELRRKAGKTQREVAEALEVSEQAVRNWEKGRERPRFYVWQFFALAELLGCSVYELPSYRKNSGDHN